ncbi:unnamed protein product [Arabidopsis lyrata]|nr:unnamed protein product [Arabidopsis lyrata]
MAQTGDEDGGGRVNPYPSSLPRPRSRHSSQMVPQPVVHVYSGATTSDDVSFNSYHLLVVAQPPHTKPHRPSQRGTRVFVFGLIPFRPLMFSLLAHSSVWSNKPFNLKPNYKRCDPNQLLQKPRSSPNSSLSIISQHWCRFMEPIDRGLQLKHILPLLLCWYNFYLRTLPLESPMEIIYEIKRVKKNGIMIPSPQSGGYRSFFNPLSHTFKQTPTDYRIVVILLLADEQIHVALLVPSRVSAMDPLSTSCSLVTVTITSSNASSADVVSTNRVITCAKLLSSFCLQALMDPSSNFISYLCVAIALPLLCCLCFILSFVTFVFLATLTLVLV